MKIHYFLFVFATLFFSCAKNDYNSPETTQQGDITGTWESISSEIIAEEGGKVVDKESTKHTDPLQKQTIVFRSDKSGMEKTYNEDTEMWDENEFTYTIKGNKVIIHYSDESATGVAGMFGIDLENFEMTYAISGNTLKTYFEIEFIGTVKVTTQYIKK
ncbi:lipocalin family protein [Sphingobacterium bovistauri]|uniref:Lipocalin family protein n=1 Tax=Sphingobacterium bovistauri TaxID=2781959 RepID=A0ABS7Z8K0_9SPHI|nr:lipocalin family protein [Sphingobacterium bovistauri]MCA5006523.1 lipocalin family protein [Sphingobacterium bovistauri]